MAPQQPESSGEWNEYRRLVVLELERLNLKNDSQDHALAHLEIELRLLKVKSGFWGFLAGCVPSLMLVIFYLIFRK